MTAKQKITEILKAYTKKHNISASSVILEEYAEELLANGVIVPPCKVGGTVYRITKLYSHETIIVEGEVFEVSVTHEYGKKITHRFYFWAKGEEFIRRHYSIWCDFDEIGKTVFFTKEEAEEKLRGLGK
jgi:hypothetical protein